jgi:hypothetical protein
VLIVTEDGLGSGTIISSDGQILTNWHVLGGADWAGIVLKPKQDGTKITKADIRYAKVIKVDEVADLALLKLVAPPVGLKPVELGAGDLIQVGADVHVIGHPTGEMWTYTKGFVSQIRKEYVWEADKGPKHKADVLQTQTPINPGNSGGPLFSDEGRLIGVATFKAKGEGLNFAVSVDEVNRFLKQSGNVTAKADKATVCKAQAHPRERMTIGGEEGYATLIDVNCDNEAEAVLFEPDNKNEPIQMFIETKKFVTITLDIDRDGRWDKSLIYEDPKGKPLFVGLHPDGKLKPSSLEPYRDGRDDSMSANVRSSLQRALADTAVTRTGLRDPADEAAWLKEMSRRLAKHMPDEAERLEFLTTLHWEASRAGIDPQLMLGLIEVESGFQKYAVSTEGARGYTQVMPYWVSKIGSPDHNLFQLRTNLRYGSIILRHYIDLEGGNLILALGRYNDRRDRQEYPHQVIRTWKNNWHYAQTTRPADVGKADNSVTKERREEVYREQAERERLKKPEGVECHASEECAGVLICAKVSPSIMQCMSSDAALKLLSKTSTE